MSTPAGSEERYYERIKLLQERMYESERRRLELERELFTYSRSDKRVSQIKCSKLHSYLKEICDREARAKMRNLELLRDVECIEISMKRYSPDHGLLQQQKADFLEKVSRTVKERKKTEQPRETEKVDLARDACTSHAAEDFKRPPEDIFMAHQTTSRGSDAETGTTSVHSHQALLRSPNGSRLSRQRLLSGRLKDFRVVGEDGARKRAHLSDDISDSNGSPDGCNLSDKHERTVGLLPSVGAAAAAAGSVAFGSDDEQEPSPLLTLSRPEENPSPGGGGGPERPDGFLSDDTHSRDEAHIMKDEERGLGHSTAQTAVGKEAEETPPGNRGSVSTPSSDAQLSESSASYLSVSLTQSESDEDPAEGVASERNGTTRGGGGEDLNRPRSPESALHSEESEHTSEFTVNNVEPSAAAVTSESLSQEGLCNLLDSIEGRLGGERGGALYANDSPIDGRRCHRIISLCEDGAGLEDEDLDACGAVVLRGLQMLSRSTEKGCVLPQDVVAAQRSGAEPHRISTSLPPDAARLWDRWFKHALVLKERRVLSTERLVRLFTPLLVKRHATYGHQAKVLLRTLLSRSSEESPPSAQDHGDFSTSSSSPSSPPADVKPAAPERQIAELQSAEEDSRDESPAESGPIRETKAYRLLKQSAMQARLQSSEEEDEDGLLGINHGHEEDVERAKRSSHQDPYARREKTASKARSALQSKAFWGESDDSDTEIEAALRPQTFITDDIDDFYD